MISMHLPGELAYLWDEMTNFISEILLFWHAKRCFSPSIAVWRIKMDTHTPRWPPASWDRLQCPFSSVLAHQRTPLLLCVCVCLLLKWCRCVCVSLRVHRCVYMFNQVPMLWGCICQPLPPLWSFELAALSERASLISGSLCNQCPTGI